MSDNKWDDLEILVEALRRYDQYAWRYLVDSILWPRIRTMCRYHRLTFDETIDILGSSNYDLLNKIHDVKESKKLTAYIARMVKNKIIDFKTAARRQQPLDTDLLEIIQDNQSGDFALVIETEQMIRIVLDEIMELRPLYKDILLLKYFYIDEPSYEQIAQRLSIPTSSVGPYLQRAINELKTKLRLRDLK